jgi:ArsR family transcriptional regulator
MTAVDDLAGRFHALSEPNRLRILALLPAGTAPLCTTEIVKALGDLAQPTVTHHLNVLRKAGLVSRRREGVFMRYQSTGYARRLVDVATAFSAESDR